MLTIRSRQASTKLASSTRMNPARQTSSTRRSQSSASASAAKARRSRCGMTADGNTGCGRDPEARRFGPIADDEHDLGRVGRIGAGLDQRPQIGSAARDQHADPQPRHRGAPARRVRVDRRRVRLSMASSRKLLYDRWRRPAAAKISDRRRFAMALRLVTAIAGERARRSLPGRCCCSERSRCGPGPAPAQESRTRPIRRRSRSTRRPTTPRRRGRRRASTGNGAPCGGDRAAFGLAECKAAEARRQGDHRHGRQFRGGERTDVGGALCCRLHLSFPALEGAAAGPGRRARRQPKSADKSAGESGGNASPKGGKPARSWFCRSIKDGANSPCGTILMRGGRPGRSGRPEPAPRG